ncbi:hypothetical protein LTR08_008865 [Meristemomyces frigidus]|nr:hypothetical protein LTR08_008865 [Meristemomyces frigidus]
MPTVMDRAMNNRNLLLAFAGIVTAVTIYSIWGTDIFPSSQQKSPALASSSSTSGSSSSSSKPKPALPADPAGEPEDWSEADMRKWLNARRLPPGHAQEEELVAMVRSAMRAPGSGYSAKLRASGPMGDVESWSEEDMKMWLEERDLEVGHAGFEELIAMVRSAQRAPKV